MVFCAALLADGEGQALQELVVGVLDEAVELLDRVVAQHPQLGPLGARRRGRSDGVTVRRLASFVLGFQRDGASGTANSVSSYTSRKGASSSSVHCRGGRSRSSLPAGGLIWSSSGCE